LLDLWMHASILVQFTDQADAYTAQITTETNCVIRHRAATRKRVARVVSSNGTEDQGTVLHRFGHGGSRVQIPAHGGHAIATHAGEGRTQAHSTAVRRWTTPGAPSVLAYRSGAEVCGEGHARP